MITGFVVLFVSAGCSYQNEAIDRFNLVTRHNIEITGIDSLSPLTVGNGKFAFTADITGLQSFPSTYENGIPLGTQSDWGWHSFPNDGDYDFNDVVRYYDTGKDSVPYLFQFTDDGRPRQIAATDWLRENPHRLHLGTIGLEFCDDEGTVLGIENIQNPAQSLLSGAASAGC